MVCGTRWPAGQDSTYPATWLTELLRNHVEPVKPEIDQASQNPSGGSIEDDAAVTGVVLGVVSMDPEPAAPAEVCALDGDKLDRRGREIRISQDPHRINALRERPFVLETLALGSITMKTTASIALSKRKIVLAVDKPDTSIALFVSNMTNALH